MIMPAFTAEASLYKSSAQYYMAPAGASLALIVPQQFLGGDVPIIVAGPILAGVCVVACGIACVTCFLAGGGAFRCGLGCILCLGICGLIFIAPTP